jgi:hypothetical protein
MRLRTVSRLVLPLAGLLVVLAVACLPGSKPAQDNGDKCGVERWAVKTLSDGDASRVNLTPVAGSVSDLRSLPAPADLPDASRIAPTELTTFTVTVRLIEFKIEGDHDVHVVVADPADASKSMIVEFPDAEACSGADISAERLGMETARAALIAAEGEPSSSKFKKLSGQAVITGVGFFDFLHGQTGVAPNCIELHPVLKFELPAPTATPPATAIPTTAP